MRTTRLLVLWARGWTEAVSTYAETDLGFAIEGALGLGAFQSQQAALNEATNELYRLGLVREEIAVVYRPPVASQQVYGADGFGVGDVLTITGDFDFYESARCVAIAVKETDDGYVESEPTFGEIIPTETERRERTLEKFSHGTLGGDSKIAQPLTAPRPAPSRTGAAPDAPATPEIGFASSHFFTAGSLDPDETFYSNATPWSLSSIDASNSGDFYLDDQGDIVIPSGFWAITWLLVIESTLAMNGSEQWVFWGTNYRARASAIFDWPNDGFNDEVSVDFFPVGETTALVFSLTNYTGQTITDFQVSITGHRIADYVAPGG